MFHMSVNILDLSLFTLISENNINWFFKISPQELHLTIFLRAWVMGGGGGGGGEGVLNAVHILHLK